MDKLKNEINNYIKVKYDDIIKLMHLQNKGEIVTEDNFNIDLLLTDLHGQIAGLETVISIINGDFERSNNEA